MGSSGGSVTSSGILDGTIANSDVASNAAIAYSKLNLASSIVTGDVVDGTLTNADINASAAIAASKLSGVATSADPLGLGYPTTSLRFGNSAVAHSAVNYCVFYRVYGAGTITALRVKIITQSGNLAWGVYSATGTGISRKPGSAVVRVQNQACPAPGSQDLALGGSFAVNHGDYFAIAADNTSVALCASLGGAFYTGITFGESMTFYQAASFTLPSTATPLPCGGQAWEIYGV